MNAQPTVIRTREGCIVTTYQDGETVVIELSVPKTTEIKSS
jgi:hypothetical protein